jgi:fructuronate reductase
MAPRLSPATLEMLPPRVARPTYDREVVRCGIVHLGIGAFHRAHQAVVFDDLIGAGDPRWGVVGVSMRSPDVRSQLAPQSGLYTVSVRDGDAVEDRVVGAVRGMLVAPEDPESVVEALASPETHIVTLTITEKGYRLDPASGTLNTDDPDVAADILDLSQPRTAPGLIAAGLSRRRERGLQALTAISCDNLPHNGARLRAAVLAMARNAEPELGDWIERNVAFPQTMVDRIVPATTAEDVAAFAARAGVVDQGLVKTEPFFHWVIEERFAGERPGFPAAGVQVTQSVAPWEAAKLRLLNGAHSAMAYLGGLAGLTFVHDFIEWPEGFAFVERLWDEAEATLSPPPGLDLPSYRRQLLNRFRNSALRHRLRQIAMDGSQKLPQRLLAPIAERLDRGQPIVCLAMAVAAWIAWLGERDDQGAPTPLDDPMASALRQAMVSAGANIEAQVAAVLKLAAIVPSGLGANATLIAALVDELTRIRRLGARGALRAFDAERKTA